MQRSAHYRTQYVFEHSCAILFCSDKYFKPIHQGTPRCTFLNHSTGFQLIFAKNIIL